MTQNPKMTLLRTALLPLLLVAPIPAIGQGADPITNAATAAPITLARYWVGVIANSACCSWATPNPWAARPVHCPGG